MQNKKLKIAIQMDDITSIKPKTDSSLLLGLGAQKRGHQIFIYQPQEAFLLNNELFATLHETTLFDDQTKWHEENLKNEKARIVPLSEMDVILIRQDPPFDLSYITYTYWLEQLPRTLVLNPPRALRDCPEKLFVTHFPEYTPPTLISSDPQIIADFHRNHEDIVLKPLYSFGGQDVFHIDKNSDNLDAIISALLRLHNSPIIAQAFLKAVIEKGDTRVIMIDGEIAGILKRIPKENSIRANLAAGGRGEKGSLTEREHECCITVGRELKKRGIILAGIDLIDDHLIEINITSPTGLRAINALTGANLEQQFWDVAENIFQQKNKKHAME